MLNIFLKKDKRNNARITVMRAENNSNNMILVPEIRANKLDNVLARAIRSSKIWEESQKKNLKGQSCNLLFKACSLR